MLAKIYSIGISLSLILVALLTHFHKSGIANQLVSYIYVFLLFSTWGLIYANNRKK